LLPFELRDQDLISRPSQLYFVSQNGYNFAKKLPHSLLNNPRPDSVTPLNWVRSVQLK